MSSWFSLVFPMTMKTVMQNDSKCIDRQSEMWKYKRTFFTKWWLIRSSLSWINQRSFSVCSLTSCSITQIRSKLRQSVNMFHTLLQINMIKNNERNCWRFASLLCHPWELIWGQFHCSGDEQERLLILSEKMQITVLLCFTDSAPIWSRGYMNV